MEMPEAERSGNGMTLSSSADVITTPASAFKGIMTTNRKHGNTPGGEMPLRRVSHEALSRAAEAEELAIALQASGNFGREPMRLSVAQNLQPQLAKVRASTWQPNA
jgi:hypothetical protein